MLVWYTKLCDGSSEQASFKQRLLEQDGRPHNDEELFAVFLVPLWFHTNETEGNIFQQSSKTLFLKRITQTNPSIN
jgi:hypothetical protein